MLHSQKPGTHRVLMIVHDGVNLVDVSGPLQAFEEANRRRASDSARRYDITVASFGGGAVATGPGLAVLTERLGDLDTGAATFDTLLVPGGSRAGGPPVEPEISAWIARHAAGFGRICSICTGAFLLAGAGLLDGRRATTHWQWADDLGQRHPAITLLADALFVEDGHVWTSAGVTAGIDLALALIERDCGHRTAIDVARSLVVYMKRSGGQSQYSAPLRAQQRGGGAFSDLHAFVTAHLAGDLCVERLAGVAGMSPRTFARSYKAATGQTPAKMIERLRIDEAALALAETDLPLKEIARRCGLGNEQNLRRLFHRHHGINPGGYRERFSAHV
jgi:transcriptional regulator GlxA family with amidase domain